MKEIKISTPFGGSKTLSALVRELKEEEKHLGRLFEKPPKKLKKPRGK